MALPLPPYVSQKEFDDMFAALSASGDIAYYDYIYSHTPMDIQKQTREVYANPAVGNYTTPLPTGWSDDEFWEVFTAIEATASPLYYSYVAQHAPSGLTPNFVERSRSFFYDFTATPGTLPTNAALTRASTGWAFNSAGVLTPYVTDLPRWSYNPSTLAFEGLLVEPAATNGIRNSTMAGASAGTPGTAPTNWAVATTVNNVTRTIALGTENGIPYIDLTYAGTPNLTSAGTIFFEPNATIAAVDQQPWNFSHFWKLQAGSFTGLASPPNLIAITQTPINAGGAGLGGAGQVNAVPTGAELETQYRSTPYTTNNATTAFVRPGLQFGYTNAVAINFTLRFGLPQMVQGTVGTSPIPTSAGAVTRAVEQLNVGAAPGTYNVSIVRQSGTTVLNNVVLAIANYVVPTDPSPVRRVSIEPVSF